MIRVPLRNQLKSVWSGRVRHDYGKHRINSERSLQASLWAGLWQEFENAGWEKQRRILVEPIMFLGEEKSERRFRPDLVICNRRSIIAVIEVKYRPHRLPHPEHPFAKDFECLSTMSTAQGTENIHFLDFRYRGALRRKKRFHLNKETLFVWCGFYRMEGDGTEPFDIASVTSRHAKLKGKILTLHAVTHDGAPPSYVSQDN
ncbi:MAG: hypothetical protein KDA80_02255 [Planctomycetaceae bacterium]|nr:hypothetical protein [Planctomycetaceae bacterium]